VRGLWRRDGGFGGLGSGGRHWGSRLRVRRCLLGVPRLVFAELWRWEGTDGLRVATD
jgi:hypothetical protein